MLFGAETQRPRIEAAESRSLPSLDFDEDEQPELRDGSEPLDVLKWELTALKLGRDLEDRDQTTKEHVKTLKSALALAAEIEVRKPRKPEPPESVDDQPVRRAKKKLEKIEVELPPKGGTEDNPIPATKSLDKQDTSSSAIGSNKWLSFNRRETRLIAIQNSKKPPLPPRSRPPSPTLKTKEVSESLALPFLNSRGATASTTSAAEDSIPHSYSQPIVITSVDSLSDNYDQPIILHSGDLDDDDNDRDSVVVQSNYTKVVRDDVSIDSLVAKKKVPEERIIPPCQNSSIVKSAYAVHNSEVSSNWPEQLTVASDIPASNTGPAIVIVPDHVDLSQMDADELEEEYARLIKERRGKTTAHEDSPETSDDDERKGVFVFGSDPPNESKEWPSSPLKEDNEWSTSPLKEDNEWSTSPSKEDNEWSTSPSKENKDWSTSPSKENKDWSTSPSKENKDWPTSPSKEKTNWPTSPSKEKKDWPTIPSKENKELFTSPEENKELAIPRKGNKKSSSASKESKRPCSPSKESKRPCSPSKENKKLPSPLNENKKLSSPVNENKKSPSSLNENKKSSSPPIEIKESVSQEMSKVKPLEELRKRSMVTVDSSDREDQDGEIADSIIRVDQDVEMANSIIKVDQDVEMANSIIKVDQDVETADSIIRMDQVVEMANSIIRMDQDVEKAKNIIRDGSPQVIHLEESEDIEEQGGDDEEEEEAEEEEEEEEEDNEPIMMRRDEPPEFLRRANSIVGQEPPETLRQNSSIVQMYSEDNQEDGEDNYEGDDEGIIDTDREEEQSTADEKSAADERDRYFNNIPHSAGSPCRQPRIEFDFPSIERVVADYFGAKNRLMQKGSTDADVSAGGARYSSNIFTHAGGCCIGIP